MSTAEFTSQVKNPHIKTETVAGAIQELISNQISYLKLIEQFNEIIKPDTVKMFNQVSELILDHKPDLVLYHPKVMSAPLAAKSIGAKSCLVEMIPLSTPTKEFGLLPGIGRSNFGIFNKLTFKLIEISANIFKKDLSQISKSLQQTDNKPDCYMCLVSPRLLDRPSDWPDSAHLVGPWFVDHNDGELDQELEEFLRLPTVYVGFGSMSDKKILRAN
jgi:sterol 3beta-glucosyltransferase